MESLPKIPSPPAHRWREFRIKVMPVMVFVAGLGLAVFIWKEHVAGPTVYGEVESVQTSVSSSKAGTLTKLTVARFQRVRAGDAVGEVSVTDPKVAAASLAVIQAEIELLRANMKPVLGLQQNAMHYEELRLEWMKQRTQLLTARINLQFNEVEFRRMEVLFKDKIISERVFEQARAAKERLQTEVEELTKLVNEGEDSFKQMRLTDKVPPSQSSEDPLHAAIVVQEEKLRLTEAETSPLTLKAPMDGVIRLINKRPGEVVTTGEPIITVNALRADHIVGYMHPPISVEPKVGMTVQVRTRGFNRQASSATILQVGSELEVVPSPTHARGMTKMEERGLPFLVNLPAGLNLRPGELVDLILQARSR